MFGRGAIGRDETNAYVFRIVPLRVRAYLINAPAFVSGSVRFNHEVVSARIPSLLAVPRVTFFAGHMRRIGNVNYHAAPRDRRSFNLRAHQQHEHDKKESEGFRLHITLASGRTDFILLNFSIASFSSSKR